MTTEMKFTMKKLFIRSESGLTLVEMLTAVSIIVIMGGSTYAVFNSAVNSYQQTQSKVLQAQRCRVALDTISTDLSQMQADTSDELLALYSEDVPTMSGDRDILSIITIVKTDIDVFTAQLDALKEGTVTNTPPLSDVRRVAYYVGPKVPIEMLQSGVGVPSPATGTLQPGQAASWEVEELALYRIVTTGLNPELVIESMHSGSIPTVDENGVEIYYKPDVLIDGIINFDLKYLDEEAQVYDTWDQTDVIPTAVQVLVSVIDDERQTSAANQTTVDETTGLVQGVLTQSTMVYLPASANNAQ